VNFHDYESFCFAASLSAPIVVQRTGEDQLSQVHLWDGALSGRVLWFAAHVAEGALNPCQFASQDWAGSGGCKSKATPNGAPHKCMQSLARVARFGM